MKLDPKWILGPVLILGLNAPGLMPLGCASHDVTEDPRFRRAQELIQDGVSNSERDEFADLLLALEQESKAREAEGRHRLDGVKAAAEPFVPGPFQPLVDPAGELGLLVWFLLSERKNKKAIEALKSAASR